MMRLWQIIVPLVVFGVGLTAHGQETKPNPPTIVLDLARTTAVSAMLPEKPTCFGRPITDRTTWDRLAATEEGKAVTEAAQRLLTIPMPEMTDDIFLIFSRTGSRTEGDRIDGLRRGRVGTFTKAELLENSGRFIPELESTIRPLCEEKTWVGVAHDRNLDNFHGRLVRIDLYSSALAWNLAVADSLLGERLSPDIRSLIRKEIQWRVFDPFHRMVEGKQSAHWLESQYNWNAVCLAGVTGAALALLESRQERAWHIVAAEEGSRSFLRGFTSDGYCSEGTGYWNYGFGHYVLLAEEIRLATGGKIDLLARKEALAPATFAARFEIVDGIYPAFADSSPGARPSGRIMNLLNERLGLGLPPVADEGLGIDQAGLADGLMYLFPVPAAAPVRKAGVPIEVGGPRSWFSEANVLICRPAKGSSCRLATAIIGNHNGVAHNHNDVGSFMVVLDRQTLIVDPGAEAYTARTFSPRRYESNVLNSFGHCVPLVAGKMQEEGAQAKAVVLRTTFTDAEDSLAFDIRSAYAVPELQKLTRTYVFSRRGAGSMTVTDDIVFSEPSTFETALITLGRWNQTGPGTLRIEEEGASILVEIDTGGTAFKIVPTQIDEHVHTERLPTRIGIQLEPHVQQAKVTTRITPVQ